MRYIIAIGLLLVGCGSGDRPSDESKLSKLPASVFHFVGNNGVSGIELYVSNGKTISLVRDYNQQPNGSYERNFEKYVQMGAYTYFIANDGISGEELWRTDGTDAGTQLLVDAWPGSNSGSPSLPMRINTGDSEYLYFFSYYPLSNNGAYRTPTYRSIQDTHILT